MKTSNLQAHQPGAKLRVLLGRAVEAEKEAEAAHKRARLAKAQFKEARRVYKQARKAAKAARKAAKRAAEELQLKDRYAKAKKLRATERGISG